MQLQPVYGKCMLIILLKVEDTSINTAGTFV